MPGSRCGARRAARGRRARRAGRRARGERLVVAVLKVRCSPCCAWSPSSPRWTSSTATTSRSPRARRPARRLGDHAQHGSTAPRARASAPAWRAARRPRARRPRGPRPPPPRRGRRSSARWAEVTTTSRSPRAGHRRRPGAPPRAARRPRVRRRQHGDHCTASSSARSPPPRALTAACRAPGRRGRRPAARHARRPLHRQQLGEVTTAAAVIAADVQQLGARGDHLEPGIGAGLATTNLRRRQHGDHCTPSRSPPRVVLLGDAGDVPQPFICVSARNRAHACAALPPAEGRWPSERGCSAPRGAQSAEATCSAPRVSDHATLSSAPRLYPDAALPRRPAAPTPRRSSPGVSEGHAGVSVLLGDHRRTR